MESLVAMMAFCEAPFDGTSPASSLAAGNSSSSTNVPKAGGYGMASSRLALLAAKWPMERLAAMVAFCEAPFDGTFDGTSAPSSDAASDVEDTAALRRPWLADAKELERAAIAAVAREG